MLLYNTRTGEVRRHEGVAREADMKQAEQARRLERRQQERAERGPQERPVRDAAHLIGQHARSRALWGGLVTQHRRCLALTVQALFETCGEVKVEAKRAPSVEGEPLPEVLDLIARWTNLRPDLFASPRPGILRPVLKAAEFHDALMTLDAECLMELLTYLTHDKLGHWAGVTDRPEPLALRVALAIGADARLAESWCLTPEFLNAHTTAQLHALVEEMPATLRPALPHGLTKRDLVGRLMECAQALHEARWVPDLVRFHR